MLKFIFTAAAFHVWSSYLLRQEDDTEEADASPLGQAPDASGLGKAGSENLDAGEDQQEAEEPMFIPLTWSWLEEGDLYSSSDPEWQEFVQISKDRQKLQKLRSEYWCII